MSKKIVMSILLAALLLVGSSECLSFASDTVSSEPDVVTEEIVENEDVTDVDLIINSMEVTQQKLDVLILKMESLLSLQLILVCFETMRIVRSWSKGVGIK